ncbi:hypothetical protein OAG68_02070 [bacterium]|nr:hypothetical protein [bacterium]
MVKKTSNQTIECDAFEDRIQDLMDRRIPLSSDEILQSHARSCVECQQSLTSFASLEFALVATFESEDFAAESTTTAQPLTQIPHWTLISAATALAALLLVLIIPILNNQSKGPVLADNSSHSPERSSDQLIAAAPLQPLPIDLTKAPEFNLVSYNTFSPTLRNAYQYASELPGIRPIECSFTVTIEALQKSWRTPPQQKREKDNPDLGQSTVANRNGLA